MEQDQENKVDEERLSSEIASAFLERLYRHEVEIRKANNGGHGFFPIAFPRTRETRRTKLIAKTKPTP